MPAALPCRAAEDELMAVADEKDKLAPQLEESRWRNRQLEKDVQRFQVSSATAEQVLILTAAWSTTVYLHAVTHWQLSCCILL